jgi:hypothetical protein
LPATYVLNALDGKSVSPTGYASRQEAKVERNRLLGLGTIVCVSRGPDHPKGVSIPDPRCRNTVKTSHKRRRYKDENADISTV